MKTIVMGTTNPAKIAQVRDALASAGIHVEGVADKKLLPEVVEDGVTVQENARKKAIAYAKALQKTVLSMDNALFLEGLAPKDQPGIHVRRIGGSFAATDEELLDHGRKLVESLGGKVIGYWEYGICMPTRMAICQRQQSERHASSRAYQAKNRYRGIHSSLFKSTMKPGSTFPR